MGLIGFIATVVVAAIGGYVLKGRIDKKEKKDPFKPEEDI